MQDQRRNIMKTTTATRWMKTTPRMILSPGRQKHISLTLITKERKWYFCFSSIVCIYFPFDLLSSLIGCTLSDRLVESSRMKKAFEAVYSAVLPKGSAPFVYLRYVSFLRETTRVTFIESSLRRVQLADQPSLGRRKRAPHKTGSPFPERGCHRRTYIRCYSERACSPESFKIFRIPGLSFINYTEFLSHISLRQTLLTGGIADHNQPGSKTRKGKEREVYPDDDRTEGPSPSSTCEYACWFEIILYLICVHVSTQKDSFSTQSANFVEGSYSRLHVSCSQSSSHRYGHRA